MTFKADGSQGIQNVSGIARRAAMSESGSKTLVYPPIAMTAEAAFQQRKKPPQPRLMRVPFIELPPDHPARNGGR